MMLSMTTQTINKRDSAELLGNVISSNVRVALALRDKNQSDLSRALGVSPTLISQKLRGVTSWTIADMANVGAYLDVDPSKFLDPHGLLAGGVAGPQYFVSPDELGCIV